MRQSIVLVVVLALPVWARAVRIEEPVPAGNITATASSTFSPPQDVRHLVDGSGLSGDQHDSHPGADTMWHTVENPAPSDLAAAPAWVRFDFTQPVTLNAVRIWNHNQAGLLNRGFRKTRLLLSADGSQWSTRAIELKLGTGLPERFALDVKTPVKSVIIAGDSNHGGSCYGLSEVQFMATREVAEKDLPFPTVMEVTPLASYGNRKDGKPGRAILLAFAGSKLYGDMTVEVMGETTEFCNLQGERELTVLLPVGASETSACDATITLRLGERSLAQQRQIPVLLKPADPFGDGMVLQRGTSVPVWGVSAPGASVTVEFAGQKQHAAADRSGKWVVTLKPMNASAENRVMTLSCGTSSMTFKDVLVGEVWFCSGQSNMEMGISGCNSAKELESINDPLLRIRDTEKIISGIPKDNIVGGKWRTATGPNLRLGVNHDFSAVAYAFGKYLRAELKVPVAVIQSAWGGTLAEPWTPPCGFHAVPALKEIADRVDSRKLNLDDCQQPTLIFNGMVHPWVPYAIRGAIWYQGESNCIQHDGMLYLEKLKALIGGWRQMWGQGDFPFYLVQIAPFKYGFDPQELPKIWESQTAATRGIPNVGMAIINDIGNLSDIHPRDKDPVGQRLARLALSRAYGVKFTDDSGPLFKDMKVDGNKIIVSFEHARSGLTTRDGKPPVCFEIAGDDGNFVAAEAAIDGSSVVVSSKQVSAPTQVRFAWNQCALPNLMNGDGLPASAFRSPVKNKVAATSGKTTGKLYFSFISSAYFVEKPWGHGAPLAGIKRMAEIAHTHGIPVTWLVDSKCVAEAGELLTRYHEKWGDEVGLYLPGYDSETGRFGELAWFRSLKYPEMKALIQKEVEAIQRRLPWANLEIVANGYRTDIIVRAAEDLGFKAVWGHCWEQAYTDNISDRGTPWGYYYASRDCFKAPAKSPGGLVAVEWTARDLNKAFHAGNPIAYSMDPNEVVQARLCDHRQIDYWKRVFDEYKANAKWNAIVPMMVHQESHEMANAGGLNLNSQERIDSTADVMDEFFKYVKSTDAVIVPASQAVAAYRKINPSTPPTYAFVHDVVPGPPEKKEKDLFIYFDVNGQLFFDKGRTEPVLIRDYINAHDVNAHDFAGVKNVPVPKITLNSDKDGVTFDCTVTATGPLPYGFAFWGDYTGQTISVDAPSVTKVLDGELAYVAVVLKVGENHFKVTISARDR